MDIREAYEKFTEPEDLDKQKERFEVRDLATANWCLKKIGRAEKRITDAAEFVKAERARLDEYLEGIRKDEQRTIDFMTSVLQPFAADQLAGGKKKL